MALNGYVREAVQYSMTPLFRRTSNSSLFSVLFNANGFFVEFYEDKMGLPQKKRAEEFPRRPSEIVKEFGLDTSQEKALRAYYADQLEGIDFCKGMSSTGEFGGNEENGHCITRWRIE